MPDLIILDDDPLFVQLIEDFLGSEGFVIRGFTEPQAAVRALGERQPDLLVLDLMVPEVDGITLYHQLRADPATHQLPILISTAAPSYLGSFDAIPDASRHILVKPYPLDLLAMVAELWGENLADTEHKPIKNSARECGVLT